MTVMFYALVLNIQQEQAYEMVKAFVESKLDGDRHEKG